LLFFKTSLARKKFKTAKMQSTELIAEIAAAIPKPRAGLELPPLGIIVQGYLELEVKALTL
jgi:hypothetical protein